MFEFLRAVGGAVVREPPGFPANGTDLHGRNDTSGRNRVGMIFEIRQFHRSKYNAIPAATFTCLAERTGKVRTNLMHAAVAISQAYFRE
jgi:hypothetical protein